MIKTELHVKEPSLSKFSINKLEASKRQIDTSILLFFNDKDCVSMHTLISAADNILADLISVNKTRLNWLDEMLKSVPQEYKKEIKDSIRKAQNFFKHADRDPAKILKFNSGLTEIFIFHTIGDYKYLTSEVTPLMCVFRIWFQTQNKHYFPDLKMMFDRYPIEKYPTKMSFYLEALQRYYSLC